VATRCWTLVSRKQCRADPPPAEEGQAHDQVCPQQAQRKKASRQQQRTSAVILPSVQLADFPGVFVRTFTAHCWLSAVLVARYTQAYWPLPSWRPRRNLVWKLVGRPREGVPGMLLLKVVEQVAPLGSSAGPGVYDPAGGGGNGAKAVAEAVMGASLRCADWAWSLEAAGCLVSRGGAWNKLLAAVNWARLRAVQPFA
jgi:hypothetical protein